MILNIKEIKQFPPKEEGEELEIFDSDLVILSIESFKMRS